MTSTHAKECANTSQHAQERTRRVQQRAKKPTHHFRHSKHSLLIGYMVFSMTVLSSAIVLQHKYTQNLKTSHQLTQHQPTNNVSNVVSDTQPSTPRVPQKPATQNSAAQADLASQPLDSLRPSAPSNHTHNDKQVISRIADPTEKQVANATNITIEKMEVANTPHANPPKPAPRIAIIIDDIGYQLRQGKRAIALPGDITLAFLPFSPYASMLAETAHFAGKETMLHAPMEPTADIFWGDGLDNAMPEETLRSSLSNMLKSLPHVKGVNNHMGSRLTQNRSAMNWLMSELTHYNMYFIDSLTTAKSQAAAAARAHSIPTYSRDIFLDNTQTPDAVKVQFNKLVALAKQDGFALGIGHPYSATLDVLEAELQKLDVHGVTLVPVSNIIAAQRTATPRSSQHNPQRSHPHSHHPHNTVTATDKTLQGDTAAL